MDTDTLPKDDYSLTLSRLLNNPAAIVSTSTIDAITFLGSTETWIIKTVRVDGADSIFLQTIDAEGGRRFVLPPAVTAAMARQRDATLNVARKRSARRGAATRKAKTARR